jgi:hypothetical protein
MNKKTRRNAICGAIAVGAAAIGVLAPVAAANAATTGNFVLCARGNYAGFAQLSSNAPASARQPGSPGVAFAGGACTDVYMPDYNYTVTAEIWGYYNDSGQPFYIGEVSFNPTVQGMTVDMTGITTDPSMTTSALLGSPSVPGAPTQQPS